MNNYDIAVRKTAQKLGIPIAWVRKVYDGFWQYIKDNIESIPMMDDMMTEEEFAKYNTVFNVPGLCKIHCMYNNYLKKRRFLEKRKQNAEDKESTPDVHGNTRDDGQIREG